MNAHRATRPRAALLTVFVAFAPALSDAADRLNFVACPIVRDTASVPCWLAEHEGEMYFLTLQSDVSAPVTPPWLGYRVLVEGTISQEARICGGIVLKPVQLSVLPDPDPSCTTMLPAEERYNLTFEPPRPPGPSAGRLAFDRTPAAAPGAAPAPVEAGTREFVVPYTFDGLVAFNHSGLLSQILNSARTAKARAIEIVGYRGAVRLSNGQTIVEEASIAQRRAEQVATLLRGAGLTTPEYTVRWVAEPAAATGIDDHLARKVVVTVTP